MSSHLSLSSHIHTHSHTHTAGQVLKVTAQDSNKLEGVIFFEFEPEKNCVYFGPFAVRAECRGKGHGRALIQAMEVAAKESMRDTLKFTR